MPMRVETLGERFWAKVDTSGGWFRCWPWRGAYSHKRTGPPRPVFWIGYIEGTYVPETRRMTGQQLIVPAARVALSLHDGVPLHDRGQLQACHTCANPACVNPWHLYWGTMDDNRVDRYGPPAKSVAEIVAGLG